MLWDPRAQAGESDTGSGANDPQTWVEPLWVVPLYVLAVVGLFAVAPWFGALALVFVGYETAMAWIFAGTTRYRVPWDFVLALLAAAAVTSWPFRSRPFRLPFSQKR